MKLRSVLVWIVLVAIVGAGSWLVFRPRPIIVETAPVTKGRFIGTIIEDGKTRVRNRFTISAPLTGRLFRITLRAGDTVTKGQIIAKIQPSLPPLLDPRTRRELEERVGSAEAAVAEARATQERLSIIRDKAKTALTRALKLRIRGVISASALDETTYTNNASERDFAAATMRTHAAEHSLAAARAALRKSADPISTGQDQLIVTAPVNGQVLRIHQESAATVNAAAPLVELGNPIDLEIIVDLLTIDAVRVPIGARVSIEHWGGQNTLVGRVRRVEPSAFTKISALGVEEQRVWVIIDIVSPAAAWSRLADGFRVETKIIVTDIKDAILVPIGALFRRQNEWHAFVSVDGQANLRKVKLLQRSERTAAISSGLIPGDKVILFPPSSLSVGYRVTTK